ncbi:transcriptional regulator [Rhizobium sp. ICMP 5592]|nr:transcriptional regulator [Rhizobium sp. ICMP 5592]
MKVPPSELVSLPAGAILSELVHRMDGHDHDREAPVREVMARLGDRWSHLILLVLSAGTFRHATLRRLIAAISSEKAISQRMLTLRLRALERDGMVVRAITPTVPPRVDYSLTPMGAEFVGLTNVLLRWIEQHDAEIQENRRKFQADGG